MVAFFIPIFVFLYKKLQRKGMVIAFILICLLFSFLPVLIVSEIYNVNSFPGLFSTLNSVLLMKPFYRMPCFIFGISLAIMRFEHKYVGTTNDGTEPFARIILQKWSSFKISVACYVLGIICIGFPSYIMLLNNRCVAKDPVQGLKFKELTYCWTHWLSSIYNMFGQSCYCLGLTLFCLPGIINQQNILRKLVDSHFWHVLEELTFSAMLL